MTPTREPMHALTSLSPAGHHVLAQQAALQSWIAAGLDVRSFNHPDEIDTLRSLYDVTFVPSPRTTAHVFGRHYTPIKNMLEWAEGNDNPVMIINSDIQLRLARWELQRLRWASHAGLCYFVRHNHDGDPRCATREAHGIDAFLFTGRDAAMFPDSIMSMGQPFWDYWLPSVFASAGRRLSAVEFPAAFHQRHPMRWSWETWRRCALEFARVTGTPLDGESFDGCLAMAGRVRQSFDRHRVSLSPGPRPIREWVERTFNRPGPKTFLELGAHCGTDTAWLSKIPGVTMHAFEPDPRNHPPPFPNVTMHRAAIAEADGVGDLLLSEQGWGQPWTYSSSLKRPKYHLVRYPVTFGATVRVETIALDSVARRAGLGTIDFIWADVQGAEGEMVRGGLRTLSRTRYLYTAYSDDESYDGQATLCDLLALLPAFRVIDLWPDEVLLENRGVA